jgi:hypothetical protein
VTKKTHFGSSLLVGTEQPANTAANGMAAHPAGSGIPGPRPSETLGRDALLRQLIGSGLIQPDPLGDQLAGWTLTDFAQRCLHALGALNNGLPSRHPYDSEKAPVGLAS